MSNRYQAFIEEFEKWDTIALTAPAGADGDSVGTQCALKEYFNSCYPNKTVRIINEDPCPARYRFLRESTYFEVSEQIKGPSPELWICVDGGPNRLGDHTTELWKQAKRKAQIDHHAFSSCDLPVDIDINDDQAASTTEILFHFFNSIDFKMSPSVAEALYVGLVYDTGLFKHSNTTPEVMRMGASLLELSLIHI